MLSCTHYLQESIGRAYLSLSIHLCETARWTRRYENRTRILYQGFFKGFFYPLAGWIHIFQTWAQTEIFQLTWNRYGCATRIQLMENIYLENNAGQVIRQ